MTFQYRLRSRTAAAKSQMLTSVDLNFFPGDVARCLGAEEENDLRDLVRGPDALHRYFWSKPRLGFGRKDFRLDLSGSDRIDPNAMRRQVVRHLPGQTSERGF